ncbi:MAG TPA: FHA domain-containing protein, partial [Mycobacterium sp.]|nr:FHA domain-containing protein [Mycobacterium sp.]
GYPDQRGYQDQGGYPDQRGYQDQGGYPDQRGYQDQGGYPDQGQGGYPPPSYEQRPPAPAGYGDQGYRPGGGYGPPGGGQQGVAGYGDYGRGPAGQDEGAYGSPAPAAPPEQRPAYPEQGGGYDQGYQQGGQGYGRQDYESGDYTQYAESVQPGGYGPPAGGGYAEPAGREYDWGQSEGQSAAPDYGQGGGYGGYAQGGYGPAGAAVTLQLDDGSGRTYQLREGSNIVGRGQDAQFRLPDTGVSRRHLEIRWDGQVALLSDLNSTNGTTVNNAPVQEWQLADGDVIRLGHSEIIVRIH